MARVYADVNQHMPRAYWDYDSVNITWGVLENYEVVRKIGTYVLVSAFSPTCLLIIQRHRQRQILRGLRRHQYCQLPKMRHQGPEAGQEEEDQEGD